MVRFNVPKCARISCLTEILEREQADAKRRTVEEAGVITAVLGVLGTGVLGEERMASLATGFPY